MTPEEKYLLAFKLMWFTVAAKQNPAFEGLLQEVIRQIQQEK